MRIKITPKQLQYINEMSFRAYHGTPHGFDKFDINKVGSGESSQWFGWGIYLTDSEEIADWYSKSVPELINQKRSNVYYLYFRGNLIGKKIKEKYTMREVPSVDVIKFTSLLGEFGGEGRFYVMDFITKWVVPNMRDYFYKLKLDKNPSWSKVTSHIDGELEMYIKYLDSYDIKDREEVINDLNSAVNTIKNLKETDFEYKPVDPLTKTYRYDVTVNKDKTPEQYDFMSWYDELTPNQKQKVTNQIKVEKLKKNVFYIVKSVDEESNTQPKFFKTLSDANQYKKSWNEKNTIMLGVVFDQVMVQKATFSIDDLNGTVKDFYTQLCGLLGSPKDASMFLLRAGIDGIKYPSNTVAGGESKGLNYVIFDDKSINIDKRNERDLN